MVPAGKGIFGRMSWNFGSRTICWVLGGMQALPLAIAAAICAWVQAGSHVFATFLAHVWMAWPFFVSRSKRMTTFISANGDALSIGATPTGNGAGAMFVIHTCLNPAAN